MPWLQISISTNKKSSSFAEEILLSNGACSVTFKDAADEPILEPAPGETPVWQNTIVTGLFEQTENHEILVTQIHSSLAKCVYTLSIDTLEDQDWSRAWMEHYRPMQFGKRLWVCPWHIEPPLPGAVNLRLDPGLAFGTGTHPTTSLCLAWLDQHISCQSSLLDFGCGSGILAIAALMLGVHRADAIDIDPQALDASQSNANANHVSDRLCLFNVTQLSKLNVKHYNVVIANILSGSLIELAPQLTSYTLPGADIVLSGILREQADEVIKTYAKYFKMTSPVYQDDWVLLHGCRLD